MRWKRVSPWLLRGLAVRNGADLEQRKEKGTMMLLRLIESSSLRGYSRMWCVFLPFLRRGSSADILFRLKRKAGYTTSSARMSFPLERTSSPHHRISPHP
jgi:hypothetical protein